MTDALAAAVEAARAAGFPADDPEVPVVAAFLVPWNVTLVAEDDPFVRERIDYLRAFV